MAIRGSTVVIAAAAVLGLAAPAASGGLISNTFPDCGAKVQPFVPWHDSAPYMLVPDGGLEGGGAGWTLSGGAAVVSGNEPFYVNGASDSHSLSLPDGSSATTAPVCIGLLYPTLRLFAVNTGSTSSRLRIQVTFRGLLGTAVGIVDGGSISAGPAWAPSPVVLMLANVAAPVAARSFQIKLTPMGSGGSWRVDDVYVDPWLCR